MCLKVCNTDMRIAQPLTFVSPGFDSTGIGHIFIFMGGLLE